MLACMRSCFLFLFFLAFAVASLPVLAQIKGVPASVTSFGFGGSTNPNPGARASVTSLGPNGYGDSRPVFGYCCNNFFLPANPNPPLFSGRHHHHRRHQDHNSFGFGFSEPVYVPYAVPYVPEGDDDDAEADGDYVRAPGTWNAEPPASRAENRGPAPKANALSKPARSEPERPVTTQLSTVLIFKDGRQSDVLNYAIVGDTLFDFEADRTRKILLADLDLPATQKLNDDRGVDFEIPSGTSP